MATYNEAFDAGGFTALQAALTADITQIQQLLKLIVPADSASTKLTYTTGTFQIEGSDYHFTQPAFAVPGYGVLVADELASAPTGTYRGTNWSNAEILAALIASECPYLVAGAAA